MNNFLDGKEYIDLDSLYSKEYLENQYKGKGNPFVIDGEVYFVRRITDENRAYKELLAEELLNVLEISHVSYKLVKLFGNPCLICKSFFKDDLNIVNGYEILEQYNKNKQYDIDYMNNLDMIILAFLDRYKISQDNYIFQKFTKQLYSLFCFDILFGNSDRKSDNWTIQEHFYKRYDGKLILDEINLGTVFDNERIFEDNGYDYSMGIHYNEMTSANNNFESIKKQISNNNYLQSILSNMINKIDEEIFLKCIYNVEVKINSSIPIEIKRQFLEQYHLRVDSLKEICKSNNHKV